MGFRRGGVEVAAEAEESMPAAPRNRLRRRKIAERRGNSMLLEEGVRVRTGARPPVACLASRVIDEKRQHDAKLLCRVIIGRGRSKNRAKKIHHRKDTHIHVTSSNGPVAFICVHHCLAGEAWALIFASSARSDARNTPTRAALSLAPFSALGSSRKMRAFVSFATMLTGVRPAHVGVASRVSSVQSTA